MLENKRLMARDIISLLQDARLLLWNFPSVGLGAPTRGARLGSFPPPPPSQPRVPMLSCAGACSGCWGSAAPWATAAKPRGAADGPRCSWGGLFLAEGPGSLQLRLIIT